jgi:parallel beta-helix repeat protein
MTTVSDGLYQYGGVPVGGIMTDGNTYFVDPTSGADSNTGKSPDRAKATLQAAIDLCEDNRGDVIVRLPGSETPSSAVLCNKAGITIVSSATLAGFVGYGTNPHQPEKFSTYPASTYTSGPMVIVSKPCAIIGLEFVTRNTTSAYTDDGTDSGAALVFIGEGGGYAGGFSLVKNCRFVDWWGNDWGIELAAGAYNRIESCVFEGYGAGILVRSTASNNAQSNTIINCRFETCVNGIEHKAGSTPHDFLYSKNSFIAISGVDIDTTSGLGDGMIAENNLWHDATGYTDLANEAAVRAAGIASVGNNFNG